MRLVSIALTLILILMGCTHQPIANRSLAQESPSLVCNIRDFGAKGGASPDTLAIQAAVDACQGKGGLVLVPAGRFLSGTVQLGSNMTFQIAAGATLVGVRDSNAYPLQNPPTENSQLLNCRRALLYSVGADNLTIEGPGTIDGSGDFQAWQNVLEAERPMAMFVVQGHGLKIQNLRVERAAMWSVVLMETQGTSVSGLQIHSVNGNTRDGLDLVDGSDIKIDNVTITSEDDSICLKSGLASGLQHVWVTNSRINGSSVANGLKFGTASKGLLKDIHFENIVIEHVAQAAMALESVDGSRVEGVTFRNITYRDVGTGIFVLLGWRGDQTQAKAGSITNILFQNIQGESLRQSWGSAISGTDILGKVYSPSQIRFDNVKMTFKGNSIYSATNLPAPPPEYHGQYPDPQMWHDLPSEGLYFRHVQAITLEKTQLIRGDGPDARPILIPNTGQKLFSAP